MGGFVIPVTDAASLTVEAVLYGFSTTRAALRGEDPEPTGPLAGELVRIERDGESTRRLTGPGGQATADNLRPGSWTISLAGIQVPSGKAPEQDSLTVDLRPGQDTTVTVRVLPTERPDVQFEEGEGLSLGPDEKPEADEEPEAEAEAEEAAPRLTPAGQPVPFVFRMGPYVAQVGAFSQLSRALRRAEQVRALTDSVGVVPRAVGTDTLYGVQVGPYPSAAAASAFGERTRFPVAARRAAGGERLVVQIGAFSSWRRARRQATEAAGEGYSVSIRPETREGQTLYRVQAGRYQERAAAEQARAALQKQVPGAAQVIGTARRGNYSVQVGAFSSLEEARRQARRLRSDGTPAYVDYRSPAPPHKVLVGTYLRRAPAEKQKSALSGRFPGAFVIDLFTPSQD